VVGIERSFKWIAIASLILCLTIAIGAGVARWTISSTNGFYTDPRVRDARLPAYARERAAVADTFWDRQAAASGTTAAR